MLQFQRASGPTGAVYPASDANAGFVVSVFPV